LQLLAWPAESAMNAGAQRRAIIEWGQRGSPDSSEQYRAMLGKHGFGVKTGLKLLASAEFTAWPGVNQPDHAEIVIGAGRLAEVFPFLVALLPGPQIRRFLGDVTLLIVNTDRAARFAEEPAVGALGRYFPRFSRTRREGKHGDHDGDKFHGGVVRLANFSPAKRITAGQIMPQRVRDLNPLLIFM
jgi:hypothetical protein